MCTHKTKRDSDAVLDSDFWHSFFLENVLLILSVCVFVCFVSCLCFLYVCGTWHFHWKLIQHLCITKQHTHTQLEYNNIALIISNEKCIRFKEKWSCPGFYCGECKTVSLSGDIKFNRHGIEFSSQCNTMCTAYEAPTTKICWPFCIGK